MFASYVSKEIMFTFAHFWNGMQQRVGHLWWQLDFFFVLELEVCIGQTDKTDMVIELTILWWPRVIVQCCIVFAVDELIWGFLSARASIASYSTYSLW